MYVCVRGIMQSTKRMKFRAMVKYRHLSTLRTVGIVGGGPSGHFMSDLLTSYGIDNFIVEKKMSPSIHPQAHYINNRSMEIIKSHLPAVHKKILESISPSSNWRFAAFLFLNIHSTLTL